MPATDPFEPGGTFAAAVGRQEEKLRTAPITGNTPEVLALERRLTSPETYIRFSLDPGRDLVLQAFK